MDVGIFVSDRGVIKMTKQGGGGRGGGAVNDEILVQMLSKKRGVRRCTYSMTV